MGDISGSATANLQASSTIGGVVTASVSANLALSHRENGHQLQFGLAAPVYQTKPISSICQQI